MNARLTIAMHLLAAYRSGPLCHTSQEEAIRSVIAEANGLLVADEQFREYAEAALAARPPATRPVPREPHVCVCGHRNGHHAADGTRPCLDPGCVCDVYQEAAHADGG